MKTEKALELFLKCGSLLTGLLTIFFTVCQDVRCDVNLVGHMSDTKFLEWTVQTEIFSEKSFA